MGDIFVRVSAILRFRVYPLQRTGAVSFAKAERMEICEMHAACSKRQPSVPRPSCLLHHHFWR